MGFHQGWHGVWLITASFLAGALNAVAGGGSFLSFPALLGVGVLPIQANATNTVALWPGQVTSIAAYLGDLKSHHRLLLPVCLSALAGGLTGAIVLLHTGQGTFMALVPWLLLFATILFAVSTPVSRWLQRRTSQQHRSKGPALLPLIAGLAAVCFYIGYFGAGAGFLVMSLLGLLGIEQINEINALKVVATTMANGIAVVTFLVEKQVEWRYGLLMMVTAAVGGFLGARASRRLNPRVLRTMVVLIGLGMAIYFFVK
ncbi:MAG TPA: sulfite exporter TauE/SafE family protein [Acidobacteriaceae bacterium]|nr:sulfite exporter TauE/SafE family protein [Acidobacteriaceae bacterium]